VPLSRWKSGAGKRGQLRPITCRLGLNADHGQASPRKAQSRLGSGRKAYAHDSSSAEEGGREEDQAGEELDVAPGRLARAIAG
jgi:hypothetical protein